MAKGIKKVISKITVYVTDISYDSFYRNDEGGVEPSIGIHDELHILRGGYTIATYSAGTWKKIYFEYSYIE